MGCRLVGIRTAPSTMWWSADRLDGFDVEAQPLEGADNERPALQFVAQRRVGLWTSARLHYFAIGIDPLGQCLHPVSGGTSLSQELNPTHVVDPICGLHRIPER